MTQQDGNNPGQTGPTGFANPRDAKAQAKAQKAYNKASRPWFKKKRFILALTVLLIIIIIVATGGGSDNSSGTAGGESSETGGDSDAAVEDAAPAFPGAQEGDVVGQAGEALALGDTEITSTPIAAGDATLGPTLCTTVSLTNGSEDTIDFNPFDWKLQNPSGTILNTGFVGSDNALPGGQIAPGGNASGDVCFDGEATAGDYVLFYEPAFSFSSDRGAWLNTL